jgi:hypothetical protein
MNYRNLTRDELSILEQQGCLAEDWSNVMVKKDFIADQVRNVTFGGQVKLGIFSKKIEVEKGIFKSAGLYNCFIQDSTIDDQVYISNVMNMIHYYIQDDVMIENVNTLAVTGESTFGNGTELEILNEGGGRELIIYDRLSAQIAYMMVFYRHEKKTISQLEMMIKNYVSSTRSRQGIIGQGAKIIDSYVIRNVMIGEKANITGAGLLENGTIASSKNDPSVIGNSVVAKDFIVLSGSYIEDGSLIDKCFVGQGVRIGKQFSAENSAFFANCEGLHSEVLSVFAGPYTVTHHRSTLLIAGLFSFYNAGSGSNQSNHMYKLGPVHQGIVERGSKTGSSSYLMWPSRIGAFTIVIGKHYAHLDTSDFPFSYLLESEGKSILMPSLNLFSAGTYRDNIKWPNRDRRKDYKKFDLISFELFNPYTIGKIIRCIRILKKLDQEKSSEEQQVEYMGTYIKRSKLKYYYQNYDLAVRIFIGNEIVKQLDQFDDKTSLHEIKKHFTFNDQDDVGRWIDMAGMIVPSKTVNDLISSIQSGKDITLDEISERFVEVHRQYDRYVWEFCKKIIHEYLGINPGQIEAEQIINMIDDWKNCVMKQNDLVLKDAEKEFDSNRRIGYGIDGDEKIKDADFEAVRGSYEGNKFIQELREDSKRIQKKCTELTTFISSLS